MKILLLGSGGYRPNDRRHTACVMLPEVGLVLDAGSAFYRVSDHVHSNELHVLLSHAHLDHVMGLTYLFDLMARHPGLTVYVHGEPDKLATVERHLWHPGLFPVRPPCVLVPFSDPSLTQLPGEPRVFPLRHLGGSVGFRFQFPAGSFAYVTDTMAETDASYVEQIRGVDLLIHECYFRDDQSSLARLTGHSCASSVAAVAREAQVGRLVLVHFNPLETDDDPVGLAEMRRIFPATIVGADLMSLEL